jgi:hypothetical protein
MKPTHRRQFLHLAAGGFALPTVSRISAATTAGLVLLAGLAVAQKKSLKERCLDLAE